jgi:bidirectional [NiFe] hydrogenase diaphorase subunit
MQKLTLVIDGKSVQAEPGTSVLEAAKQAGITIPTLCHDDCLEPYGACRMCMVEIEKRGRNKLVASCLYQVEEGLVVQTSTEKVRRIRKMIIELIWPAGQQYHKEYGVTESRFTPGMTDCSLCGMCVRYSGEVKKCNALYFKGRGIDRKPAMVEEDSSAACAACGECFNLCSGGWVVASRC